MWPRPRRNLEEKRLLWKLLDVPSAPGQAGEAPSTPAALTLCVWGQRDGTPTSVLPPPTSPGCGRLSASWQPLCGPSKPSPVAAQFSSEGSTLSGVEVELAGAGYRMSLVKKRFATGTWDPSPVPTARGCTWSLLRPLCLRCSGSLLCCAGCTASLLRTPQIWGHGDLFSLLVVHGVPSPPPMVHEVPSPGA